MSIKSRKSPVLFDSLSAWSSVLTYAFIGVFAVALVEWCGKFANQYPRLPGDNLDRGFSWWMRVPNAFIAMVVAALVTRLLIRALGKAKPNEVRLFRWFHPGLAVRDIFLLSLCFGLAYLGVTFGASWAFHLVEAQKDLSYYLVIGPTVVVLTAGAVWGLDSIKWVTEGAIYPQGKYKYAALLLYGVCGFGAMLLPVDTYMIKWFKPRYYPEDLRTCTATLLALIALLLFAQLVMWVLGSTDEDLRFPLHIKLAIVGPSQVGKTLLFVQVYRELCQKPILGIRMVAKENEATNMLVQHKDNVEMGILPPVSLVPALLDFELRHFANRLADYSWLDMPGETFNNWTRPGEEWREKRELFLSRLPEMSGVLIAINAYAPPAADRIGGHEQAYFDTIDEYLLGQIAKDLRDVSASVAIVVTQWKRSTEHHKSAEEEAERIRDYARSAAKKLGIVKFHCKVFFIDSIKNAVESNANQPLGGQAFQPWQVTKPILWLAACTCRSKMGSREMARMSFAGGSTNAIKVVGVLEQLEKDAI